MLSFNFNHLKCIYFMCIFITYHFIYMHRFLLCFRFNFMKIIKNLNELWVFWLFSLSQWVCMCMYISGVGVFLWFKIGRIRFESLEMGIKVPKWKYNDGQRFTSDPYKTILGSKLFHSLLTLFPKTFDRMNMNMNILLH